MKKKESKELNCNVGFDLTDSIVGQINRDYIKSTAKLSELEAERIKNFKGCIESDKVPVISKKQFAVYEREPAHGKEKNGLILGPYDTKEQAEDGGNRFGYHGDNYYVDELVGKI